MSSRLVFCAGTSYDGLIGSERLLATAVNEHLPVLWVDPPVSVVTPSRYRGAAGRRLTPRLERLSAGMVRLTPAALPGWSRPGVRHSTWPLVRAQIRWALRRLAARPHTVVACSLDDVLTGWPAGTRRVLYGTDDYVSGAALLGQDQRQLARAERRQLDRADLVLAISPVLRDRWGGMGVAPPRLHLLPNGCDAERFTGVDDEPWPPGVPEGRPVVGLIGQLSDRIDIRLLEAVAELDCQLLLAGPHHPGWEERRFAALVARDNVHYAGAIPRERLGSYLRAIDVGITPYRDTPFNRASFPLKTLEYLAAGRAAVSTDLPATRWLDTDLVRSARTVADFTTAVAAACDAAGDPKLVARRREFAAGHSWTSRAAEFAELLGIGGATPHRDGHTAPTVTTPPAGAPNR